MVRRFGIVLDLAIGCYSVPLDFVRAVRSKKLAFDAVGIV